MNELTDAEKDRLIATELMGWRQATDSEGKETGEGPPDFSADPWADRMMAAVQERELWAEVLDEARALCGLTEGLYTRHPKFQRRMDEDDLRQWVMFTADDRLRRNAVAAALRKRAKN